MRALLLTFCSILFFNSVQGQMSQDTLIEISELKAPTSPAFALLGVTPNEISRPKSQNDLEVALTNAFYGDDGFTIPKEFALETNPYWLFRKNQMGVKEWYDATFGDQLLRNLAISVATAPRASTSTIDSSTVNRDLQQMAFGIRTQFHLSTKKEAKETEKFVRARQEFRDLSWSGKIPGKIRTRITGVAKHDSATKYINGFVTLDKQTQLDSILNFVKRNLYSAYKKPSDSAKVRIIENSIDEVKRTLTKEIKHGSDTLDFSSSAYIKSLNSILGEIVNQTKNQIGWNKMVLNLRQTYNGPKAWLVELGAAYSMLFQDSLISSGSSSRLGIWVSPTYRTRTNKKGTTQGEIILMGRYLEDFVLPQNMKHKRFLDIGGRLVLRVKRFSISAEALGRWQYLKQDGLVSLGGVEYAPINNPAEATGECITVNGQLYCESEPSVLSDWKATINVEYRVTNNLSLTYTFGKDFDTNIVSHGGNIVNLIGLNLGLFPATAKL